MPTRESDSGLSLPGTSRVVGSDGIMVTSTGLRIDIRLPWYRSLPLSTVEVGEIRIDGKVIDAERVVFELEGNRFALPDLADRVDIVWYVLDSAYLDIVGGPWEVGDVLGVGVTLILYPPYIPGLKRVVADARNLRLNRGAGSSDQ